MLTCCREYPNKFFVFNPRNRACPGKPSDNLYFNMFLINKLQNYKNYNLMLLNDTKADETLSSAAVTLKRMLFFNTQTIHNFSTVLRELYFESKWNGGYI
jgi:hypothetical protein